MVPLDIRFWRNILELMVFKHSGKIFRNLYRRCKASMSSWPSPSCSVSWTGLDNAMDAASCELVSTVVITLYIQKIILTLNYGLFVVIIGSRNMLPSWKSNLLIKICFRIGYRCYTIIVCWKINKRRYCKFDSGIIIIVVTRLRRMI